MSDGEKHGFFIKAIDERHFEIGVPVRREPWSLIPENFVRVFCNVLGERVRQEELLKAGKFNWSCANVHYKRPLSGEMSTIAPESKLAVLAEEIGEVSRIVCDSLPDEGVLDRKKLREELVQVAAVCVAWCEALDAEATP